jgi:hypothetical protein
MGGTYRAKVGFDLGRASAEVEDGVLRLWLPEAEDPRVLETLKVGRQAEDVSWWNPLEPAEMEAAYRANRGGGPASPRRARTAQGSWRPPRSAA